VTYIQKLFQWLVRQFRQHEIENFVESSKRATNLINDPNMPESDHDSLLLTEGEKELIQYEKPRRRDRLCIINSIA
jgi:hypothetical protein